MATIINFQQEKEALLDKDARALLDVICEMWAEHFLERYPENGRTKEYLAQYVRRLLASGQAVLEESENGVRIVSRVTEWPAN